MYFKRLTITLVTAGSILGISAWSGANAADGDGNALFENDEAPLSRLKTYTALADQIYSSISAALKNAEAEHNTLKTTCLRAKAAEAESNLQGVRDRSQAIRSALRDGSQSKTDKDRIVSENFSILQSYIKRMEELKGEAAECLGESDVALGNTSLEMDVDSNLPQDDPSETIGAVFDPTSTPAIDVDPPEHASGFY